VSIRSSSLSLHVWLRAVIVGGRIDGHPLKSVPSQAPVTVHAETGGCRRPQIILGSHLYILLPHSQ
jgi:hypothetical protein